MRVVLRNVTPGFADVFAASATGRLRRYLGTVKRDGAAWVGTTPPPQRAETGAHRSRSAAVSALAQLA